MMGVTVSIIVPCYNQGEFLNEALQSVYEQDYINWECIIVNDGSFDNSETVATKWVAKDRRFKYFHQKNSGVSSARNKGINYARGIYILPLDADDKISRDYTRLAMAAFEKEPNLKLVYCKAKKFGLIKEDWNLPEFDLKHLAHENIIFSSAFFKKKDWEVILGYDEKLIGGWEDWEFWISLLKSGGKTKRLDGTYFFYRIKKESRNTNVLTENADEIYKYLSIKHADFFCEYFGSFHFLKHRYSHLKIFNSTQMKSEKFVLDLFCKTFLGFTIFGKYK